MKKRTCKRDETGFIVTFTVTFILSLILFQTMMPELSLYLLMSSAIWAGIWIKLNFYNNLVPFAKFVTIGGANLLAWLLVRFFFSEGSEVLTASHGIALSLYGVYLIIVSIAVYRTLYKRRDCNGINEAALLPSRQRDLERILEYISRYSIVGINGRWGTGKTFLMRECVRMLKEEYEIIQVDLLSSNLDELQSLLLKEIEKVMARNGILSVYSNELAGLFQASGFGRGIQGLLFQQKSSYSALLSGFLGDLKKLNKKILIIYEDIDRIQRIEIISKIFNISEKLAGENIKIVYEYSQEQLREKGFEEAYVEKYIPFTVNLTDADFFEMLAFVLQERGVPESVFSLKDLDFLRYGLENGRSVFSRELNQVLRYHIRFPHQASFRTTEHFVDEMIPQLSLHEDSQDKETVIAFFLLKHLLQPAYELLSVNEDLDFVFAFIWQEDDRPVQRMTASEVNALYKLYLDRHGREGLGEEAIMQILGSEANYIRYVALLLFDYESLELKRPSKYDELVNEDLRNLHRRHRNEKKNRIVWNLLASGKSQLTDAEYAAKEFTEMVLSKPKEQRRQAVGLYWEKFWNGQMDNETIFRIGIPVYFNLFQAFAVTRAEPATWISLLDLYFDSRKTRGIDSELLEVLNCCVIKDRKVYFHVLEHFLHLEVVGNLNGLKCFELFVEKYIDALAALQYLDTSGFHVAMAGSACGIKDALEENLEYLEKKVVLLKADIDLPYVDRDLDLISAFLGKLMELIRHENPLPLQRPEFTVKEMKSRLIHQEEYDRIVALYKEGKDISSELQQSYEEERLGAYEIRNLRKELDLV